MKARSVSLSRPLPAVSGFASRFVDEGEYEEPAPDEAVAPEPFAARILRMHAQARLRVREQGAWMWRTAIGSIFWGAMSLLLPGWWSTAALVAACLLGWKWCEHFYQYRCARIEATLWPDD